jgi:glycosyltransferase involved in cell wall biosynthesis
VSAPKAAKPHRPIPVLLVVRELASGGIERDVTKLALGFPRDQFIPYVATYKPSGPRFEELTAAGVPVLHLDLTSIASVKALKAALKLRRLIRDKGIQVVHAFDASAVFVVPLARLLRVPVVLSSMLGSRSLMDPKSQKQLAFTDGLVNAVVVNCEAMRTHMVDDCNVSRDRIELCYNGVDTREFYPDPAAKIPGYADASVVVGAVCVLRVEKNLTLLQEAFAKVRDLTPNPKLLLVGSGTELEKLQKNSQRLGIEANSIFLPASQRVAAYLRTIDIFVSCSYSEAFSNSILEAMACGTCVVGSRVGGTPELIANSEHGLLFTSNDVNDLADKLARLIQEPELRQKFGQRAAKFAATKLSMATNLQRTGDIYKKFLRARKVIA